MERKNPTFEIDEWEPACYLHILSAVIDFACYGYHIVTLKHSLFLSSPAPRLVTEKGMFKSFYCLLSRYKDLKTLMNSK